MTQHLRPVLLLSECLGVRPVRYDGNIVYDNFVELLKKYVDIIPICPETRIGLGVPRNPLVLYERGGKVELLDPTTGAVYTDRIKGIAEEVSKSLEVDGVILKSSSPSCGVGDAKVYGAGRSVLRRADGVFTHIIRELLPCLPVESERRLYNHDIRVRFLIKVFTIADLRFTIRELKSPEDLVDFHRRNKYIIMLHSHNILKKLGRLVANRRSVELGELTRKYWEGFMEAMCRVPRRGSYVSVLTHVYGHLKDEMNPSERKYVLNLLERYRRGLEDLRTVVTYFRGFIHRFGDLYLAEQRLFSPYPEELEHVDMEMDG